MDKLLQALQGVNVELSSQHLVEIARYWFWKDIISNCFSAIIVVGIFGSLFTLIFICIKNYGIGKWK